ncbi:hypothetical protein Aduo_001657 [Ancylostoma duodenale]
MRGGVTQRQENCWKVLSKSRKDVVHEVVFEDLCDCNDRVNSHCKLCGICTLQICCTCPDGYESGLSCLHTHAVATFTVGTPSILRPLRLRWIPEAVEAQGLAIECDEYVASPDEIQNHDITREQCQVNEGILTEFSKIARIMLKSKRSGWLKDWNAILQNAKKELPTELTAQKHSQEEPLCRPLKRARDLIEFNCSTRRDRN